MKPTSHTGVSPSSVLGSTRDSKYVARSTRGSAGVGTDLSRGPVVRVGRLGSVQESPGFYRVFVDPTLLFQIIILWFYEEVGLT